MSAIETSEMPDAVRQPEAETAQVLSQDSALSAKGLRPLSNRKRLLREQADKLAPERDRWAARHSYYYEEEWRYLRFLVPPGKRVPHSSRYCPGPKA